MTSRFFPRFVLFTFVPLVALLIAGCATTDNSKSTVNWNSRVGSYTYEQAVAELGAPRESSQTSDGGRTAEWLTQRNAKSPIPQNPVTENIGTGYRAGGVDQPTGQHTDLKPKDEYLRLTFDASGKLIKSSQIYR